MEITAKMVQDLRERSGAPLMDCKRALTATNGDREQAFDHLRKAGLKTADKKAGAATGEGRVRARVSSDGRTGAMVLLTCQTDFVARTDDFQALLEKLVRHAGRTLPVSAEAMLSESFEGARTSIQDTIRELVGKVGENMQLARVACLENSQGRVGSYVHHDHKKGALISLTTEAQAEKADAFLKSLGMHIVAFRSLGLRREDVPADVIEREKRVYRESDELKDKPVERHEKIIAGKLEKFLAGAALLEQPWVLDPNLTVQKVLAAELGPTARVDRFVLMQVGA